MDNKDTIELLWLRIHKLTHDLEVEKQRNTRLRQEIADARSSEAYHRGHVDGLERLIRRMGEDRENG